MFMSQTPGAIGILRHRWLMNVKSHNMAIKGFDPSQQI